MTTARRGKFGATHHEIIRLHGEGLTNGEIAERVSRSRQAVSVALIREGLEPNRKPVPTHSCSGGCGAIVPRATCGRQPPRCPDCAVAFRRRPRGRSEDVLALAHRALALKKVNSTNPEIAEELGVSLAYVVNTLLPLAGYKPAHPRCANHSPRVRALITYFRSHTPTPSAAEAAEHANEPTRSLANYARRHLLVCSMP